jgi:hypothetical protein
VEGAVELQDERWEPTEKWWRVLGWDDDEYHRRMDAFRRTSRACGSYLCARCQGAPHILDRCEPAVMVRGWVCADREACTERVVLHRMAEANKRRASFRLVRGGLDS